MTTDLQAIEETTVWGGDDLCPLRRTDLTVHELDGEVLVYDPATADTHRLNETALFIWRACDGRRNATRMAARLLQAYDVRPDSALEHVNRMFLQFKERQLVLSNIVDNG